MASSLKPYPSPPLPEVNLHALRGHILGVSVDTLDSAVAEWFITSGAASNRNALTTSRKIITQAINDLSSSDDRVLAAVQAFENNFSTVVGRANSEDQVVFEAIGSNLIQAVYNLISNPAVTEVETENTATIEVTGKGIASDPLIISRKYEDEKTYTVGYDHTSTYTVIDRLKYAGADIDYVVVRQLTSQRGTLKILLKDESFAHAGIVGDSGVYYDYDFVANMLKITVDNSLPGYGADITFKIRYFSNN